MTPPKSCRCQGPFTPDGTSGNRRTTRLEPRQPELFQSESTSIRPPRGLSTGQALTTSCGARGDRELEGPPPGEAAGAAGFPAGVELPDLPLFPGWLALPGLLAFPESGDPASVYSGRVPLAFTDTGARCTHFTVFLAIDSVTISTESARIPNRTPERMEPLAICSSSVAELFIEGGAACNSWLKLRPIHSMFCLGTTVVPKTQVAVPQVKLLPDFFEPSRSTRRSLPSAWPGAFDTTGD